MADVNVVTASAAEVSAAPGAAANAMIVVEVNAGFHVQANPPAKPNLIPVTLAFEPAEGVTAGATVYPPGKPYQVAGANGALSVYDGAFELTAPLSVAATAALGVRELHGKLRYQACDDRICLAPRSIPVVVVVRVVPAP